jgi:hypothetical protein
MKCPGAQAYIRLAGEIIRREKTIALAQNLEEGSAPSQIENNKQNQSVKV